MTHETDPLVTRLHAMGEQHVDDATRADHLARMAAVEAPVRPKRFGRFAVAAAAVVGFAFGSTGLAMAGALPSQAQDVAHDVLSVVNVNVPEGTRGQCVSQAAKITDKAAKQAAKDECPKNEGVGPDGDKPNADEAKVDKHADDPCKGKPAWAGKPDPAGPTKDELKAAAAANPDCPRGLDEDDDEAPETAPAAADVELDDDADDRAEDGAEDAREADEEDAEEAHDVAEDGDEPDDDPDDAENPDDGENPTDDQDETPAPPGD